MLGRAEEQREVRLGDTEAGSEQWSQRRPRGGKSVGRLLDQDLDR